MNQLLQEALLSTHHVQHAAIIKRKDGSVKAKSPLFELSPADYSKILMAFENPREVRTGEASISLMDVAYRAVRADNLSLYAKNDKSGIIVAKTHGHFILSTYDGTMFASVCAEAVEKLADYFRKKNK
ncbi:Profilin-4 [Chytriomyces hyalinus]|nr:profilin [Chytriomyces cf. hyalinus JEL632]KAJ3232757.1 Profilin-4 [Chytriomyces hyalinus]KAJ3234700.1 Profilin-4 [Chytriomyces hyalinus]KAJ3264257.1 Profilin-4 [Chytriomyces hyalinus]